MVILKPFNITDFSAGAKVVCRNPKIKILEIGLQDHPIFPVKATLEELNEEPYIYTFTKDGLFYPNTTDEIDLFVEVQGEDLPEGEKIAAEAV